MPYPVTFEVDYVERRSRLSTFFRLILAIPHFVVLFFLILAWSLATIVAWCVIVITGEYPAGLYDFSVGSLRWLLRVESYMLLLVDEYPPFSIRE